MLQNLFALVLAATQLTRADDFLKQLTPHDFKPTPNLPQVVLRLDQASKPTCAIPLKHLAAHNSNQIDPIARPNFSKNVDAAILHTAPVPVCAER